MKSGMIFMGMGFELVGLIVGCIYLGNQIDQYFSWAGYGTIGLVLLSLAGWLFHLIILLKKYQAEQSKGT
ncbi:MAG: AtpZ/AtpI family protein [Bdellovibrionales bacterium]|nr:AtpZ/AtpI family protein [Bdellovibrionales bacterium]